jgi:hypothetical protein
MSTIRALALHRRAEATPAHDDDEAAVGLCDCNGCLDERRRLRNHPLLARVMAALFDAGNILHSLRRSHACDPASCELCHDARMVWAVLAPLESSFEGEYNFAGDPKLVRHRADSESSRAKPRSMRRWSPDSSGNYPIHPLAIMSLMDLGQALEALPDGHGCQDADCFVCEQAEIGAYLVPMLTAAVEETMLPCPALLRRRGVSAAGAKLLRLFEQAECSEIDRRNRKP